MPGEAIPDDVRRLLVGAIPAVPHLEALLLLRAEPARTWAPAELARRLYVAPEAAAKILSELAANNLVSARGDDGYGFAAGESERATIDRLAAIYSRHVTEVARILHSKTEKHAQQFADAFLFRKDK